MIKPILVQVRLFDLTDLLDYILILGLYVITPLKQTKFHPV